MRLPSVVIPAVSRGRGLVSPTRGPDRDLLWVYDRPVLHFAIEEAAAAGADRIIIVSQTEAQAIRQYLNGAEAPRITAELILVVPDRPAGPADALACAREHVLPGPVGVILPEDVIMGASCLGQMAQAYTAGHMIAAKMAPPEETSRDGSACLSGPAQVLATPACAPPDRPVAQGASATLAAVGRYVLDRAILDRLTCTPWGDLGQEQLTAAIDADARHVPLTAFRFAGQHFPCSGHDGLLAATQARRRIVRQAGAKNVTPARMGSHRGCHGPTPPSYRA